jgi:hypothetical protein
MNAMARPRPLARWGFAALLCVAPLGWTSPASAAISFVAGQQWTNSGTGVSQLSVPSGTMGTSTKVGNMLVLVGANWSCNFLSVTGNGVTTWQRAKSSTTNANIEIWYGIVDVASTANVTATLNPACGSSTGGERLNLTEWSGVSLALDGATSAFNNGGTAASAGSITTTNAIDLVMFAVGATSGIGTLAAPWVGMTSVTIGTSTTQSSWYQITAATNTFAPSVTSTTSWDAVLVAFKGCTVTDASYVVANNQGGTGKIKVYWASNSQVVIARNTTGTFTAPTTNTQYAAGGTIGTDNVVYVGEAGSYQDTPPSTNLTYYYKVYANCALTYSAGVSVSSYNAAATPPLWTYATSAATLAPPGIDDNNVVVWGGNDNKVHGADANLGTLDFPVFTQPGGAIQSRPPIIPLAYSQTGVNVAYVSSQDGYVYAVNTSTGAAVWSNPAACSGTGTRSCVPGSNNLQGGAAVWLQAIQQLQICGLNVDAVFVGSRISGNNTGNSVYALNGGTTPVTITSGSGKCRANSTVVQPGDYLWQFTGASGGTPNMAPITSTPYIDYNNNVVWVTSNAANGLTQPSLWKINVQNGMLANGTTACGSGASTSCWSLGHTDSSPSPSGDGAWIYVGTNCIPAGCATQAATLNAVEVSSGNVKTYSPGTGGFNGTGNIRNPYPLLSTSFGTQSSGVTYVNSKATAQGSSTTSCAVDMAAGASPTNGLTAGNTIIFMVAYPGVACCKTLTVTDQRGSLYSRRRRQANASTVTVELWSATIAPGSGTIVTASFGAYSTTSICAVAQYSGVGSVANNNFTTSPIGSSTNATVTPPVTTQDTNNRVVAAFVYNNNSAFTNGAAGTLRTSTTVSTTLGAAIYDNSSASKGVSLVNTTAHATGTWAAMALELRSATVDQINYLRDDGLHAIQFAGNLSATVAATFNPTWETSASGFTLSGPVDDGQGRLYFGYSTGKMLQYDTWSGPNGVWADLTLHPAPQIAPGTLTILGDPSYDGLLNRLYVGGNDGRVYAITPPW